MNKQITYLSITQILAVHDQMIKRFGGSSGVRDSSLIQSAIGKPQSTFDGDDLYEDIFHKAAALLQSLLENHPFVDGNKRTALTSAGMLLKINGYRLLNYHEEEENFAVKVDSERLTIEAIATWLQEHSQETHDL